MAVGTVRTKTSVNKSVEEDQAGADVQYSAKTPNEKKAKATKHGGNQKSTSKTIDPAISTQNSEMQDLYRCRSITAANQLKVSTVTVHIVGQLDQTG